MFESQIQGKPVMPATPNLPNPKPTISPARRVAMILILIFVLGVATFGVVFFIQDWKNKNISLDKQPPNSTSTDLASEIDKARLNQNLPANEVSSSTSDIILSPESEIEYLSFGDFYRAPENTLEFKPADYQLPINIKTQLVNYYDFSRKINIDSVVNDLNNNGFAVIDNPFKKDPNEKEAIEIDNFYSVYDTLNKKQLPTLITSDFLTYYYQNQIKRVFKDVEENLFYDNLWLITESLYEAAKNRYNQRITQVGNVNDLILEGSRQEMAYLATALELLKPAKDQINSKNDLSDKSKFTLQEADDFEFNPPQYLKVDVLKEVELIREHRQAVKSPVLLYNRDYKEFVVPDDYKTVAKLNNFYLTTRWLNSALPIYYKGTDCPNCSLDVEDWRVSMVAASFLSQDLFDNYALKNRWARIYKVMSFFKGLRSELSLVNYRDALVDVFGKDYKIEDLFITSNPDMEANFQKFQNKILSYQFSDLAGAYKKDELSNPDKLGVKMLADFYWPNDYIFNELSYPKMGGYKEKTPKNSNITNCRPQGSNGFERCVGFGLDIINLIHPVPKTNSYFVENTNYNKYQELASALQIKINANQNNWLTNNFWSTLKTTKSSLDFDRGHLPIFARNDSWEQREVNRALGAWVNLQLPMDKFGNYQKLNQPENLATNALRYLEYGYVEPNLALVNELIADNQMIMGMFNALNLNNEIKTVAISLNDLNYKLKNFKSIIEKELTSTPLADEDYQLIDRFIKEYRVDVNSNKVFKIMGRNNQSVSEDLTNVKLLLVIQPHKEQLVLTAGPIFNYWEKR